MIKKCIISFIFLYLVSEPAFAKEMVFLKNQRHPQDIKRDITSKSSAIMSFVNLSKNMVVADVLGGGGFYSELISKKVGPKGKVYLHNNKAWLPFSGKELEARLKDNRLPNVIRYDKEADELSFSDNSLDAIFFVLGFHDLFYVDKGWKIDPKHFLTQLKSALKPGGKLLIVDHSAVAASNKKHAQKLHRIDKNFVIRNLESLGFKLIKQSNMLANKQDTRLTTPFTPQIRRKTDRFVLLFEK
ncbi:class I SAM-dependent methyltransferase [Pseudoalteromonas denitrificans]|uniref:Predicted methyltransferase n=1 Tax=Pseudoalteromonas denitrificans DSM 6059 TaxID=1123010 RepID=A0A1I1IGU1_9GAMM|nr:class I SAM-dependent methyltransferase [Pseudoalteromonas denitrificans]SFC35161.1 Predicted methyltransferase [Pseudoalteromonas denitrificans DSM 6059]